MKIRSFSIIAGLTVVFLSFAFVPPPLSGATELKIATVHLKDVYRNSIKVKEAGQKFDKMRIDSSAKIRAISEEIKGIRTKLSKGKDTLKKDELEILQKELQTKIEQLSNERDAFRVKIAFQTKSLRNSFKIQIDQIIKEKAKEKGINFVLQGDSVLYSEGMPDLTEEVVKALDSTQAPAKSKK
jgi:Skp family chaperone for outer membrane proteins